MSVVAYLFELIDTCK